MTTAVTLIPGDGIGPEVVSAAVEVIEAAGVRLEWHRAAAGAGAIPTHGTPIPAATLDSIRETKLALKGPLATPVGEATGASTSRCGRNSISTRTCARRAASRASRRATPAST